jgi:DNA-binding MarR family transcriptional regulator
VVDRFEKFTYAISEAYRCWHRIATGAMEEYGLKGSHSIYLTTLDHYPEGLTAVQLGEVCGRDKADVSRSIAKLEEKGLLRKEGLHQNLYRAKLVLTDEGKALAQKVNEKAKCAVDAGGKGLTEEHREAFYSALDIIVANLQVLSKEGLHPTDQQL